MAIEPGQDRIAEVRDLSGKVLFPPQRRRADRGRCATCWPRVYAAARIAAE